VIERVWGTKQSSCHRPFAQRIGVTHHCLSGPLSRAAYDFGIDESFAKAAAKILYAFFRQALSVYIHRGAIFCTNMQYAPN
jgi:hypothetical protein